ncbi:MAG: histidinol dehydrogenase [Micavibrio aeruginosavorus]|uniref:Histidinol dehydrogenase n=1 Tax=Micavibrio aeruginosavorus TaxID=349221 RepID=A0A2W5FL79_9BACT|nr:MAG: histidinol dehydrogenase [Micavibrio aeruginosavorus]
MTINFFKWSEISDSDKSRILKRSQETIEGVLDVVRPIIEDVKDNGDAALIRYAKKFDGADLSSLRVTEEEFAEAETLIAPDLKAAIDHGVRNVKKLHAEQMRRVETEWMIEVEPGVFAGEKVTPVSSIGLYVPRGKNAYPSALYMLAIPAVLAGVPKIVIVTPPTADGKCDPACLYAAKISGVTDIYKAGGAQAIAALAHGTESIPKVAKVVGPGSSYVAAAKLLLSSLIDAGMPAGPSEAIVLCDEFADPHNTILDLLNEAEHGPDSAGILLTHDEKLARYVLDNLPAAIDALPEKQANWLRTVFSTFGAIIVTESVQQSIEISNLYAPEHLLLKVRNPESYLPQVKNAGEVLIGEHTAFSLGNFAIGINHVLPTGGWAHSYSCTSVWDFLKRTSLSRVTSEGFVSLAETVTAITDYEGFPAHKNAVIQRKLHKS